MTPLDQILCAEAKQSLVIKIAAMQDAIFVYQSLCKGKDATIDQYVRDLALEAQFLILAFDLQLKDDCLIVKNLLGSRIAQ